MPWKILVALSLVVMLAACGSRTSTQGPSETPDSQSGGSDPDVSAVFRGNPTMILTARDLADNTDPDDNARGKIDSMTDTDIVGGSSGGVAQHSGTDTTTAVDFSASATAATLTLPNGTIATGVVAGTNGISAPTGSDDDLAIAVAITTEFNSADPAAGTVYVQMVSDIPYAVGADVATDYLSYGIWIYEPDAAADSSEIGVFVDASDNVAFAGTAIQGLTGDATYNGQAQGIYVNGATTQTGSSFGAFATLTASFGADDALGAISGTIRNFSWGNADTVPDSIEDSLVITLGSADLTTSEGGFFTGVTSGPDSLVGVYGGKFYYDTEETDAETNYPGVVAGTFSAASAAHALLGVFFAEYQDQPLASP